MGYVKRVVRNTRTSTASTSHNLRKYTVFNSISWNFQPKQMIIYNVWMDYGNHFYTDINQCFCRYEYVLEIDHRSEKVSTVLSNHVSSLLAQQNHVIHLRNDMKVAIAVINPRRACSNNSLRSDMPWSFYGQKKVKYLDQLSFFLWISNVGEKVSIMGLPIKEVHCHLL